MRSTSPAPHGREASKRRAMGEPVIFTVAKSCNRAFCWLTMRGSKPSCRQESLYRWEGIAGMLVRDQSPGIVSRTSRYRCSGRLVPRGERRSERSTTRTLSPLLARNLRG
jgi:hypothetical protein